MNVQSKLLAKKYGKERTLPTMSNSANSALPTEVYKAAAWWRRQLEQSGKISVEKANTFESNLINLLREKVVGHWHPEKPWKGQGHRYRIHISVKIMC
jgi:hypothetical protein